MEKLTILHARAAPLMKPNIDTDAIIPSREMKSVSKSGLADGPVRELALSDLRRKG
ncbi:MAG: hypothetical protein WDN76_08425 [Alphaproteobacteria bacterium]